MWIIFFILLIVFCGSILLLKPKSKKKNSRLRKNARLKLLKSNVELEQKRIDSQRLNSEIEKVIIASGLFKKNSLKWLPEIIMSNFDEGSKVIDLIIRKTGDPLSHEEKRKYGIRTNAKVSKQYFESLTIKGKKDPVRSAFTVVRRIHHKQAIKYQNENILKTTKRGFEVQYEFISGGDDGRTCQAALELEGKRFEKGEVPDLPLPNCDAEYCRCLFLYHMNRKK
jgi:hypothetical protein